MLRSPHAHARISAIDTQAARLADGVLAVFTEADLAADGLGTMRVNLRANDPTDRRCIIRRTRAWRASTCVMSATRSQ